MKESRFWLAFSLVILMFLAVLGVFLWTAMSVVNSIQQTTSDSLKPINQVAENLSTQVSGILNPTPTILPDPVTVIHDIRSLARLETVSYTIEKVVTAESRQGALGFLFGDRLILVAHGQVIAGIDLEKITPQDMWVEGKVLHVRLPEPEIFIATLDNDKSYVYDRDKGLLTRGNVNLETDARRAAEDEIEKAAIDDGILDTAGVNAENFLMRLLRDLGYPEVIFVRTEPQG